MAHTLKRGTQGKLLLFFARDEANYRVGKRGLRPNLPGASAAYIREGETAAKPIELVQGKLGWYRPGGLVEVDPELLPGVYQFGIPDAVLADGAESAIVSLRFPGAIVEPIELSLVAYDSQDADRLGMAAIGPEGRINALRGAFPRLAARELDEVLARRGQ